MERLKAHCGSCDTRLKRYNKESSGKCLVCGRPWQMVQPAIATPFRVPDKVSLFDAVKGRVQGWLRG